MKKIAIFTSLIASVALFQPASARAIAVPEDVCQHWYQTAKTNYDRAKGILDNNRDENSRRIITVDEPIIFYTDAPGNPNNAVSMSFKDTCERFFGDLDRFNKECRTFLYHPNFQPPLPTGEDLVCTRNMAPKPAPTTSPDKLNNNKKKTSRPARPAPKKR